MTFYLILFYNPIEHKNSFTVLFPDHQPEVACGVRQWPLGQDVTSMCPFHRNKICIDVITWSLRKNHSAMIIGADISIPVQVLVL